MTHSPGKKESDFRASCAMCRVSSYNTSPNLISGTLFA